MYPEYSTSKVLTMEYVEGVKVTNIEAIEQAGLDRQALAELALRSLVEQLLIDGCFHADLHPWNVLVSPDTGVITYLDAGMAGRAPNRNAEHSYWPRQEGNPAVLDSRAGPRRIASEDEREGT